MYGKEITAFRCSKCGKAFLYKELADNCCIEQKTFCSVCGRELPENPSSLTCEICREEERYNSCRKMTMEEYEKEFPGNMIIVGQDAYYPSIIDALEDCLDCGNFVPKYVYGTKKCFSTLDAEYEIECVEEYAYENAHVDEMGADELRKFVEEWNKKYAIPYFDEAKIVIDIPDNIRQKYTVKEF